MIYDCFIFFKEIDLLILRMELLNKKVGKFVIVEAAKTFTGMHKKYYIEESWSRLEKYHNKIIYIKVESFPVSNKPWECENYQRNMISAGLSSCKDDDLIMISDLDEIPNPKKIPESMSDGIVACFLQNNYYYFANNYNSKNIIWEGGTKILTFKTIRKGMLSEKYVKYNEISFPASLNIGFTPMKIRLYRNLVYILNGGWHFGWLGGVDFIISKLKSFSHQEYNNENINNQKYIIDCLVKGRDVLDDANKCYVVDKCAFPVEILNLMPDKYFLESNRRLGSFIYNLLKCKQIFLIYARNLYRKNFG